MTGVMNSVPLFLSLPGPRGHQAATASLNTEQMLDAIKRGAVKDALEAAVKILRGWDFQPAVITYTGNDVSSAEEELKRTRARAFRGATFSICQLPPPCLSEAI